MCPAGGSAHRSPLPPPNPTEERCVRSPLPPQQLAPGLSFPEGEATGVLWANGAEAVRKSGCFHKKPAVTVSRLAQHLRQAAVWLGLPLWLQDSRHCSRPHILPGPLPNWEAGRCQGVKGVSGKKQYLPGTPGKRLLSSYPSRYMPSP